MSLEPWYQFVRIISRANSITFWHSWRGTSVKRSKSLPNKTYFDWVNNRKTEVSQLPPSFSIHAGKYLSTYMYIFENVQRWTLHLSFWRICAELDDIRFICIQKGPNLVTFLTLIPSSKENIDVSSLQMDIFDISVCNFLYVVFSHLICIYEPVLSTLYL